MFLEISQNSQENTCARVSDHRPATLLKKRLWHRYFPVNFAKFHRTTFLQNTSGRLFLNQHLIKVSKLLVFAMFSFFITEAVTQRCSVKKVFLEISQNLQEKTCVRVSFLIRLQASYNLIKKERDS